MSFFVSRKSATSCTSSSSSINRRVISVMASLIALHVPIGWGGGWRGSGIQISFCVRGGMNSPAERCRSTPDAVRMKKHPSQELPPSRYTVHVLLKIRSVPLCLSSVAHDVVPSRCVLPFVCSSCFVCGCYSKFAYKFVLSRSTVKCLRYKRTASTAPPHRDSLALRVNRTTLRARPKRIAKT